MGPRGLQDEAASGMLLPWGQAGTQAAGNSRSADGFWQQEPKPCLEAKTRQGSMRAWRDMVVAGYCQGHPASGCPRFPVVPPASPGAARRQTPPCRGVTQDMAASASRYWGQPPVPLCPTLGHPWVTPLPIPTLGSCFRHPQTAKNSGFVCKVQSQGLATFSVNSGY